MTSHEIPHEMPHVPASPPANSARFTALELLEDQLLDLLATGPLERREPPRFVLHPGASVEQGRGGWLK